MRRSCADYRGNRSRIGPLTCNAVVANVRSPPLSRNNATREDLSSALWVPLRVTDSGVTGSRACHPAARFIRSSLSGLPRLFPEYRLRGGSRLGILNHRIDVDHQEISPFGHMLGDERQVTRVDKMPAES